LSGCVHTYIHTYTNIYTHIHTHIHTYVRTYIHTYIHTYTHIHTHIHTYVHTLSFLTESNEAAGLIQILTDGSNSEQGVGVSIAIFRSGNLLKIYNTD